MALPYAGEEPGVRAKSDRRRAILTLMVTVFLIDAIAIGGFFILTIFFGWDQMLPFVMVIVVSILTGFYCQWMMKKING